LSAPDDHPAAPASPVASASAASTTAPAPGAAAPAAVTVAGLSPALQATLERVAGDLLQQRRSDRRWRLFFRLSWLGLVLLVFWALFADLFLPAAPSRAHTALVDVRGEIAADTEASAEALTGALRSAFEDPGAVAVVLRINSPGGSPVQAGMLHDEIRRLKALHGKPVFAVVEELCASGAYYLAAAADEVFVDKASLVGSIGVLMDGFGFTGAMEKLGIERRLITAGEHKGLLDPFSPLRPEQRALAQAMIDEVHQQFITVVREGRGERLKDDPQLFSGLVWNGEQAVALGLADRLGNLEFVAREVVMAEEIVDYTPRANVAERLARRFGAGVGEGAVRALATLPALR
jgi:protease IV